MLKNVIFDFGQVLVRFEPSYMVGKYVHDPEDKALLEKVVFDRLYWDRLDAGTIGDDEVVALCKERLPERLHDSVEKAYRNWIYNLPEIDGMREMLIGLKRDYGIPLYLLSNISIYFSSHADEIPVLELFDKCVFSGEIGLVKPSREIFAHLCRIADLVPEETLFVDDSAKNVDGARAFGIDAYLFDGDVKRLERYIRGVLLK